jgi:RNA polymerase sigma-70 factor (ECF subfamily)
VQGFDDLYAAAYPRLVAELTLITGSAPEAEDVVQEAFARALGRWRAVRDLDEPSAWVRRVALRLAVSRWRRHQVAAAGLRRLRAAPALPKEPDLEDVYLLALMASVPLQQRAALVLHYLLDLPLAEIAEILGVPIGTVKSRLARGRVALARELREVDRA